MLLSGNFSFLKTSKLDLERFLYSLTKSSFPVISKFFNFIDHKMEKFGSHDLLRLCLLW